MAYLKKNSQVALKRLIPYYICIFIYLFLLSVLQTGGMRIAGGVPALAFCAVCAVGFIFGERTGAIFGIVGGVIIDSLSTSTISLSVILFMLCGYFCGRLAGWFLSVNLLSFAIYSLICGGVRAIFSVAQTALISTEFDIGRIILKTVIPEFIAYIAVVIPIYGISRLIYIIFRGKDKKEFRF